MHLDERSQQKMGKENMVKTETILKDCPTGGLVENKGLDLTSSMTENVKTIDPAELEGHFDPEQEG